MARSGVFDVSVFQQFAAINVLADPGHDKSKLVVPNGVQVQLVWQLTDGKVARNILGADVAPGFAPTAAIAESVRAAITTGAAWTAMAAFIGTGVSLTAVQLRDIRQPDQPLVPSTGAGVPGTSVSTALPSETAIVVTLRTAKVGPGNRGRVYLPGWASNAAATGDVIAPAVITAITNWLGVLSSSINTNVGTWSITQPHRLAYTSPTTGTQHAERPAAMAHITSATVKDNHWDSQRRRGLK